MISYSFFDSVFFIPVYALLLILFAYLGNKLAKREKRIYGGERNYASQGLLQAFLIFLSLLYTFTLSGTANHFRDAKTLVAQEADAISEVYRWARQLDREDEIKFVKLLLEYSEFRSDYSQSFNRDRAIELQGKMWDFIISKEKDERYAFFTHKILEGLNTTTHLYWDKYYSDKDRVPLPVIMLIFLFSMIVTFFLGYTNENRRSHFAVNVLTFVSLNLLMMFTIREIDMLYHGMISVNPENIKDLVGFFKGVLESNK